MADALDSGSSRGCSVRVQVPSPAPNKNSYLLGGRFYYIWDLNPQGIQKLTHYCTTVFERKNNCSDY